MRATLALNGLNADFCRNNHIHSKPVLKMLDNLGNLDRGVNNIETGGAFPSLL